VNIHIPAPRRALEMGPKHKIITFSKPDPTILIKER
jgi:hypothetical protein